MSERCERTSKRRSGWPSTLRVDFIVILPNVLRHDIRVIGADYGTRGCGDEGRVGWPRAGKHLDRLKGHVAGRKNQSRRDGGRSEDIPRRVDDGVGLLWLRLLLLRKGLGWNGSSGEQGYFGWRLQLERLRWKQLIRREWLRCQLLLLLLMW